MIKQKYVLLSGVVLSVVVAAQSYAADPESTVCTAVSSSFSYKSYDVILMGDQLISRASGIEKEMDLVKYEMSEFIGEVEFNFDPITNASDARSISVVDPNTYIVCEVASCPANFPNEKMLVIEKDGLAQIATQDWFPNSHIARATLSQIEAVEDSLELSAPYVLTREHLLVSQ